MNKKSSFGSLVIATAILGAMVLSSCSHDDYYYSEENAELVANEKYAIAFEKAFGKVGSNVDWGFSSKNTNARAITRAKEDYTSKGNLQPTITFPEKDCDASNYKDAVPSGVEKMPDNEVNGGTYYINGSTKKVQMRLTTGTIYVTGTVDLTSTDVFEVNAGTQIYLVTGSTLKLGATSALNLKGDIYIADGATLETADHLKINGASKVYNHGNIIAGTFEVNSTSFLYNVGKLEADNVNVESTDSRIVNDNTIEAGSVTVNAGAVQNNAEWEVSGTTLISTNALGWVNNGKWKTYNYSYVGGSENVINNCYLWVTNDFEINISSATGAFKIDTGGGVLAKNFYGGRCTTVPNKLSVSGPFKIVMGQMAVFKVENIAQLEGGRNDISDDYNKGIYGPTEGGYAVFQAERIVRAEGYEQNWGAVTYGGNLYVSAKTHFAQGNDGFASHLFIFTRDGFTLENIYAEGFSTGMPEIYIPKTECSPGFKGGDPLYRVIAEDLSAEEAGDFDFNDVVFDVVKAENGRTTLKLICAGGVLPLRVRGANEAEGTEIHSVFGEMAPNEKGHYQMYNTGAGPTVPEATFTVEGEYTTPEQIKNIIIEVKKENQWMPLYATRGQAACKILVDDMFKPVRERRNIADENKKFTKYVQGEFVDDFWWK
ncbi:MAG: hypothetical protein J5658_02285 [Prevotella sp.]|nr:hypothetical protein [Prevotella sp.]